MLGGFPVGFVWSSSRELHVTYSTNSEKQNIINTEKL